MWSWIAGSLFGLVVVSLVLVLLRRRRGAEFVTEVHIARPPADVWRYMSEPQLVMEWVGGLVELESTSGTELAPGMRDRMVVQMGSSRVELLSEVTAVEPGKRLAQRIVPGKGSPMRFEEDMTFELDDLGSETRFRVIGSARYFGIGRLLAPLFTIAARRKLQGDLARLKSLVETSARNPAQPQSRDFH